MTDLAVRAPSTRRVHPGTFALGAAQAAVLVVALAFARRSPEHFAVPTTPPAAAETVAVVDSPVEAAPAPSAAPCVIAPPRLAIPPLPGALDPVDAMPRCHAAVRVVGAVESERPEDSFALLAAEGQSAGATARIGSPFGHGFVEAIGWSPTWGAYVVVGGGSGATCFVAQSMPPMSESLPSESAHSDASADGRLTSGVTRLEPDHFAVRRALITRLVADPNAIAHLARAVPYRHGSTVGVLVASAPGTTSLARFGLRDGDVLVAVNNRPLDAPDHWLEAYMAIESSPRVALAVVRDGRPMQLDFELR